MTLFKALKKNNNGTLKTLVGDFRVIKILGQGGNASVFLFEKEGKEFAFKFIALEQSDSEKINRFKDEYFCAQQLGDSPYIAKSYHLGELDIDGCKYLYIIYKRYDCSLKDYKSRYVGKVVSKDDIFKFMDSIFKALEHTHSKNVIHRDIKPENILYDNENNMFVLADFGIANFKDLTRISNTHYSSRMANFSHSAPEQREKPYGYYFSSDIFSVGSVLCWFIHGYIPQGENRVKRNDIPNVERFISKCIQNNPSDRFQSIEECLVFLEKPKHRSITKTSENLEQVFRSSIHNIRDDQIKVLTKSKDIELFLNRLSIFLYDKMNVLYMVSPYSLGYSYSYSNYNGFGLQNNFEMYKPNQNFWGSICEFFGFSKDSGFDIKIGDIEVNTHKMFIYKDHNCFRSFFIILHKPNTIGTPKKETRFFHNSIEISYEEYENGMRLDKKGNPIVFNFEEKKQSVKLNDFECFLIFPKEMHEAYFDREPEISLILKDIAKSNDFKQNDIDKLVKIIWECTPGDFFS